MVRAQEILGQKDYANYRNVRAAAVLFIVFGGILAFGGIGILGEEKPDAEREIPQAAAVALVFVGIAGVSGGIAAQGGNRRWAKLAYVMAVPYLLIIPVGTLVGYVVLSGLSGYLESKEKIRIAGKESNRL